MRRLIRSAVTVGVACALPASSLVLAQVQKADAPRAKDVMKDPGKGRAVEKETAVKKDVTVKVGPARAVLPAQVNVNVDPQVQQWVQQFRPILRSEYYFIRTVTSPTPDQRKRLAREGERALGDAARGFAQAQMRPRFVNGQMSQPDPRKMIQDEMLKAVKAHLSPEQAARYQAEIDKRNEDRKHATVRNLVAKLDQDLILNAHQREKIGEALTAQWDESWVQWLEMFLYGDQFFPKLPNGAVAPHLDEKQKKVWESSQRNQQVFFFGFNFVGNMMAEEDPADDKDLIEAREAAQAPPQGGVMGALMKAVAPPAKEKVEIRVEVKKAVVAPAAKE